jgi:hypothetical protein
MGSWAQAHTTLNVRYPLRTVLATLGVDMHACAFLWCHLGCAETHCVIMSSVVRVAKRVQRQV